MASTVDLVEQKAVSVGVKNHSSYPTRRVGTLVRRVLRDLDADDVDVTVKDGHRMTGRYHPSWYPDRRETREKITLRLPAPEVFPVTWSYYERKREMPPPLEIRSWEEALVALAAHEGQHHRQMPRNGYGRPGSGKTGKALPRFREAECEWAAYRAVQRYRDGGA